MTRVSSQDLRNIYEQFYNSMRNYLWPYDVLEQLADVEVNIYSAFINIPKLESDFNKLKSSLSDVCKEDGELKSLTSEINEIISQPDIELYHRLNRVAEVNPTMIKTIRTLPREEDLE